MASLKKTSLNFNIFTMNIVVNGKPINTEEQVLASFIEKNCKDPKRVIVELNERVLRREAWKDQMLNENDRLELMTMVGGG